MSYYTPFIPSVWRKDLAEGSIRELSSNHVPEDCSEAGFQALVYFQGVHPLRVTTVTHHETQELVLRQERGFGVKDVERGKFVESAVGLLLEDLHLTILARPILREKRGRFSQTGRWEITLRDAAARDQAFSFLTKSFDEGLLASPPMPLYINLDGDKTKGRIFMAMKPYHNPGPSFADRFLRCSYNAQQKALQLAYTGGVLMRGRESIPLLDDWDLEGRWSFGETEDEELAGTFSRLQSDSELSEAELTEMEEMDETRRSIAAREAARFIRKKRAKKRAKLAAAKTEQSDVEMEPQQ